MSESINNLYFDDITIENDFRGLLSYLFSKDYIFNLFGEINFLPMDINASKDVDLPAVTIQVVQDGAINTDDIQRQNYSSFTIQIDVYTSGENRVLKNRQLCNEIIKILQSNGQLEHYYCRGLTFEDNREVGTMLDSAYRRVIRMSGICDNKNNLIKGDSI